jgi:hypothetical protein
MFYESEGNFNILNRLDFGFLIGWIVEWNVGL